MSSATLPRRTCWGIFDLILAESGEQRAQSYVGRIESHLATLETFPFAGREIADYRVVGDTVLILRVLYAGRDLSAP